MVFNWYRKFLLQLALLLLCFGTCVLADEHHIEGVPEVRKWSLTLYGGASAQDNIGDVYSFQATFPDDSYIAVVALTRELWRYRDWIGLEAEGQVGKHFGTMDHWEINGLLALRWHRFPWDKYLETSFAVGNGLSVATEVPDVEEEGDDDSQELLNYLLFELALGLPQYPQWAFVIRLHHRSGVFGLFNGVRGGANFVCGGIKYRF